MLLSELVRHPDTALRYLERYVNDGSPSGFSTIHTTSLRTSPFETTPWFSPYILRAPPERYRQYGHIPDLKAEHEEPTTGWLMVHPDMAEHPALRGDVTLHRSSNLKATPTASGRTIQLIGPKHNDYVKLHYDGILGRVHRGLPFYKAVAGPELSTRIQSAVDAGVLGERVTLLREVGARSAGLGVDGERSEWSMVWREGHPYGAIADQIAHLVPAFSLFSLDRLAVHHQPLLKQIIDSLGVHPEHYVFDVLIAPILEAYFAMIERLGLQPEWNAQNLLLGFDPSFSRTALVMRDLESIDKDLTLMRRLGIDHDFLCGPYKCIEESQYNYSIKHSFMYDFKLGESILAPLLAVLEAHYRVPLHRAQQGVRDLSEGPIARLGRDFFPRGRWFSFAPVLVDQSRPERPYVEHSDPKFRA